MQALRAEIPYCEQYVNQCRQRMLKEFDKWYKMAFVGGEEVEEEANTSEGDKDPKKNKAKVCM